MKATLFLLLSALFFGQPLSAQFPESRYKGDLQLDPPALGLDSVPVVFTIEKLNDSDWVWRFDYENLPAKNYLLNRRNGVYELDEKNGIVLNATYLEEKLKFLYTLDSVLYEVSYDFSETGKVYFDLRYYSLDPKDSFEGMRVNSFRTKGRQFAMLRKE